MNTQPFHARPVLHLVPPWSVAPAPESPLRVTHDDQGALWVLALAGEADISTRDVLARGLATALAMNRGVLAVDVSGLEFCDSWCVDAVLEANSQDSSSTMVLVGGRGMVGRVFDLLDPDETLARHA